IDCEITAIHGFREIAIDLRVRYPMTHLNDRLAEFFYNELSPGEMNDARRHIEQCADCRLHLQQFENIHITLRAAPDWDPPRNIVFSAPHRRSWVPWFDWRPLAASIAAAAFVAAIVIR